MKGPNARITIPIAQLVLLVVSLGAPGTTRADGWFSCEPTEVIEFNNRAHVRCSNTWGQGVRYIAIGTNNAEKLRRFIAFGNTALVSNKYFRVYLREAAGGNTPGCRANNCRTPTAFGVMNR